MVRSSSQILLNLFHQNATDLQEVRTDLTKEFRDTTIKDLNKILQNIGELNESIKNSQILGNPALELKDERNELIDELASYLPITVKYRDHDLGAGFTVEELDIYYQINPQWGDFDCFEDGAAFDIKDITEREIRQFTNLKAALFFNMYHDPPEELIRKLEGWGYTVEYD